VLPRSAGVSTVFDTGGGHRGVFVLGSSLSAGNDGAGMAHAAARRCGLSRDESDDRLFNVCLDPRGRDFFRVAADFANQDYGVRFWIVVEKFNGIEERRAR